MLDATWNRTRVKNLLLSSYACTLLLSFFSLSKRTAGVFEFGFWRFHLWKSSELERCIAHGYYSKGENKIWRVGAVTAGAESTLPSHDDCPPPRYLYVFRYVPCVIFDHAHLLQLGGEQQNIHMYRTHTPILIITRMHSAVTSSIRPPLLPDKCIWPWSRFIVN